MTRIIFVRHAQSLPSPDLPEEVWPLSEKGQAQARDLAPVLGELGVSALASSPFLRAVETLKPFADQAGLPIHVDEDLRERNLSAGWLPDIAGVEDAVRKMHADLDYCLPGGESGRECLARFEAAIARVAALYPGQTVAIGSHGGVLGHLAARHRSDLPADFWRSIRNPHLFFFDLTGEARWTGERTLDGSAGVASW